ncbi:hypothetical protein MRX96_043756 [Rhipicephalus microplus]
MGSDWVSLFGENNFLNGAIRKSIRLLRCAHHENILQEVRADDIFFGGPRRQACGHRECVENPVLTAKTYVEATTRANDNCDMILG